MPNDLQWLDQRHEVYDANVARWVENERRLLGGDLVLPELRRFIWETRATDPKTTEMLEDPGVHYGARQGAAVYLNFPEWYVLAMKGHLFKNRPLPGGGLSFGTLGDVRRERDQNRPTPAEMIYYNADGVGNDGSQWDNFWLTAWCRAAATSLRWIMVEAPSVAPGNREREMQGQRPYLVEFAPQQVTNWHFDQGRLSWAIVRVPVRKPKVSGKRIEGIDAKPGYLLLVRNGVDDLGDEYKAGGWWLYNSDKEPINENGKGTWAATRGDIPLFPLFYERSKGVAGAASETPVQGARAIPPTQGSPAIARCGTTELGQAAIAYMNLSSAADYDAWDAAASVRFLLGVDKEAFNLASHFWNSGQQAVPVPANDQGQIPQVVDGSTGSVAADVFDKILKRKLEEAEKLAIQEATGSPDASGEAKRLGFGELKAPRLANIASEVEQAQNVAIYFLELRWGNAAPSGSVQWPREFEIVDVVADIQSFFELERISGLKSPTLDASLMMTAARESGHITEDEVAKKIEKEYSDAAETARKQREALATLSTDVSDDTGDGGEGGAGGGAPPFGGA